MVALRTTSELAKLRKAGAVTAQALAAGGAAVKAGVTTGEIDRIIRSYIISKGGIPSFFGYDGFPGNACISVNDEVIHGIPGKRVLCEGDLVSIDVGAIIDGYHGDTAASFAVGALSKEAKRLSDATRESLNRAIEAAQVGARIGDIGFAVQSYVEALGFGVVREFVGHGVGREMHEPPEVPNYGRPGHGARLAKGMVIAIEPMITQYAPAVKTLENKWTVVTLDHGLAAHFEHTIAITENGPVILTLP